MPKFCIVRSVATYTKLSTIIEAESLDAALIEAEEGGEHVWIANNDSHNEVDIFSSDCRVVTDEEAKEILSKPQAVELCVTEEERDMMIAALRLWQATHEIDQSIIDIAENERGDHLSDEQIDGLCESINHG